MIFTTRLLLIAFLGLTLYGCARELGIPNERVLNSDSDMLNNNQINNIIMTKRVELAHDEKKTKFYSMVETTSEVTASSNFGEENEIANLDCIAAGIRLVLRSVHIIPPAEFWEVIGTDKDMLNLKELFEEPYSRALETLDMDFIVVAYHQLIDVENAAMELFIVGLIGDADLETSSAVVIDMKNKRLIDAVEVNGWHKKVFAHFYVVIPLAKIEHPAEDICQMVGRQAAEVMSQSLTRNKVIRIGVVAAAENPYPIIAPDKERACSGAECMRDRGNTVGIAKEAGTYCPNADLGHADAQLYIGDIYKYGKYAKIVDPVRAWVWYSLASQNGDEKAKRRVSRLTDELTPEQLEEAKRQLTAWMPGQCIEELTRNDK
jgi:hypothetical protein